MKMKKVVLKLTLNDTIFNTYYMPDVPDELLTFFSNAHRWIVHSIQTFETEDPHLLELFDIEARQLQDFCNSISYRHSLDFSWGAGYYNVARTPVYQIRFYSNYSNFSEQLT